MQQLMFAIYDDKAKAYLPPFFLPTKEMAQRTFSDCINDSQHAFGLHPEDYTLFHLGGFDNLTAETITTKPHTLGNGLIYKTHTKQQQLDLLHEEIDKYKHLSPDQRNDLGIETIDGDHQ